MSWTQGQLIPTYLGLRRGARRPLFVARVDMAGMGDRQVARRSTSIFSGGRVRARHHLDSAESSKMRPNIRDRAATPFRLPEPSGPFIYPYQGILRQNSTRSWSSFRCPLQHLRARRWQGHGQSNYVESPSGSVVTNPYGECWRTPYQDTAEKLEEVVTRSRNRCRSKGCNPDGGHDNRQGHGRRSPSPPACCSRSTARTLRMMRRP